MNRTWPDADVDRLKALWTREGGRVVRIARLMGRTKGQISGKSRILGLQFHGGRGRIVALKSPAAVAGISVHHARVIPVTGWPTGGLLKTGDNQRKLGDRVCKGAWKGMPIFSLTLEERATCPRSCKQWTSCYGNSMGLAKRYAHGPALEEQLVAELAALQRRYPRGFVVRLHILGDFYSTRYVSLWRCALEAFPALRVFGYTARLPGTAIGDAVARIRDAHWDRFAIRTSDGETGPRTAVVANPPTKSAKAENRLADLADYILCPAQTGKSKNCGTCALCWSPAARERAIVFEQH